MEEQRARRVVDRLRDRGVDAYLERPSVYQFAVRVALPDRRQAIWDGPDAVVMLNGVLVGFVPASAAPLDEDGLVDLIASTTYDRPIATRTTVPAGEPLPREGGVFRRFLGDFRE